MIRSRRNLTIERRRTVRADLKGDGSVVGEIVPRERGMEYVTVVLGEVRKGEQVTSTEVLHALSDLHAAHIGRPVQTSPVQP